MCNTWHPQTRKKYGKQTILLLMISVTFQCGGVMQTLYFIVSLTLAYSITTAKKKAEVL